MSDRYDAIIIGSGQGGMPISRELAQAGWRTAQVEQLHVGGTCINDGCTPTKTMYNSGRVAYLARRARDYGVADGSVEVDMAAVRRRKQRVVDSFRSGDEKRIEQQEHEELVRGHASFLAPDRIQVNQGGASRELTAKTVIIDVGARPSRPPIEGLDQVDALTSTTILELDELPEHLLVVGGGYVGVEFAQMFRRFGSRVTILQRGPSLMPREDGDVCDGVLQVLREDGIEVVLDVNTDRLEKTADGAIQAQTKTPQGGRSFTGSHVLLAAGRTPNTGDLGLDEAGIETDEAGFIKVNDRLQTNVPNVYAIGDAKGGPQFTHISYDDYRVLRDNLLHDGNASIKGRLVPYTMFTDPQLGRVGLTEKEAREQGRNIKVAKIPMTYVARAIEMDETRGFMKAVVDADTEEILGFAALAVEGGELMAMVEIAMVGKVRYPVLREGIFAHPTLAESLNTLFTSFES
jgi:pyruvate/2-oxoglutarate dehydrogenase complex dihydrolipoamide dehydrogenase (E3) component